MIWVSAQRPIASGGSLYGLLEAVAGNHGDRIALVDGVTGAAMTYRELFANADRVAAWLGDAGLAPGDRIALWVPNVPEFAVFTLGGLRAGSVITSLNPAASDLEAATQFADSNPAVVLTIPERVPAALSFGIPRVVSLGEAPGAIPFSEVIDSEAPSASFDAGPDDLAFLPYSSGTTGAPKGVMLTHDNLVTNCRQLTAALEIGPEDVTLALAPFFHILGFAVELVLPLSAGATVVTMPRFDPIEFLDLLEHHRVTYLAVPPPVGSFLAHHPAVLGRDLSSLDLIAVGGAAFPADAHRALADRLPWCAVGQGWGLTETTGGVCVPRRGEGTSPGTVGCLLPETELRVVDLESGEDLGPGHDGELWVRGPQVMAGYLCQPEATAEMVDSDGWLRTGDLGHIELDGEVVIVDRLKDLIKVDGFQVSPVELEAVLLTHPSVQDAAAIARPNERHGELPVAFVVARDSAAFDAEAISGWVAAQVAPYKRLAAVYQVENLPRTPSGKLLRRTLTEPALVSGA